VFAGDCRGILSCAVVNLGFVCQCATE